MQKTGLASSVKCTAQQAEAGDGLGVALAPGVPDGLPLPKWCFVLLAVPTFYLLLVCLAMAAWVLGTMGASTTHDPPVWLAWAGSAALCVTYGLWVVYLAWIGFSRRLAWREKCWWSLAVLLLNMAGMPWFYVFMVRRYLGLEGRTGPRDEIALGRFLGAHGVCRERLSGAQLAVLRTYCRGCRLARWGIAPLVVIAVLGLYMAAVTIPRATVRLFGDWVPTRTVFVDSASGSRQVVGPEPETVRLHVQNLMMFGAMAGALAQMSLLVLGQAVALLWGGGHRQAMIELLKATAGEPVP